MNSKYKELKMFWGSLKKELLLLALYYDLLIL